MKSMAFLLFLGLICGYFLNAQMLDEAILAASVKISRDLPNNTKVAIVNFSSPSEEINNYIIDELYGNILRNRRIKPIKINQDQLQSIHNMILYNTSGILNIESVQNIGYQLEVEHLITGSLELVGFEYNLVVNAVDTEEAVLQSQYITSLDLRNDQQITLLFGSVLQSVSQNSQTKKNKAGITSEYEYYSSPGFFIGGDLWYYNRKTSYRNNIFDEKVTVEGSYFGFSPLLGYRFGNSAIGIIFYYEHDIFNEKSVSLKTNMDFTSLGFGIFGDINLFSISKFTILGRLRLLYYSFDAPEWKVNIEDVPSNPKDLKSIAIHIYPKFQYRVSENFALNASIGWVYFKHSWSNENAIIQNEFGASVPSGEGTNLSLGFCFFF